jgi:ABC-type uncharacterized transport system permease subunit
MSIPGGGMGSGGLLPGGPLTPGAVRDEGEEKGLTRAQRSMLFAGVALLLLVVVREVTDQAELTSSGTFATALRTAVPILLVGLGALYSERAGVVNIGLEGMMILGTWFGAWAGWKYGAGWGVFAGMLGGGMGGLLHAVATVTFGVDQVVSGVAINILGGGVARFLSVIAYSPSTGGGITQSPPVQGQVAHMTVPILAGGKIFGWRSPDLLGALEKHHWFLLSDVAALVRGVVRDQSWLTLAALALVPITYWVLWRTVFGLRLRSVGEHPLAAQTLGVPVYTMKYAGVVISGLFAGLAGSFLVIEASSIYREGQTAGRGFIGLAALIFGNYRPGGILAAAGIFGYPSALVFRSDPAVRALLLYVSIGLALGVVWFLVKRRELPAVICLVLGGLFFWWWAVGNPVPRPIISFTPHITTLLVLSLASQRLRPPAADGRPYRKGQQI